MEFDELIGLYDGIDGDEERAQAFRGSLEEFGRLSEGANSRIAELERELAEARQKYTDTAARNYELMTAVTSAPSEEEGEPEEEDPDREADEAIQALFGKEA